MVNNKYLLIFTSTLYITGCNSSEISEHFLEEMEESTINFCSPYRNCIIYNNIGGILVPQEIPHNGILPRSFQNLSCLEEECHDGSIIEVSVPNTETCITYDIHNNEVVGRCWQQQCLQE